MDMVEGRIEVAGGGFLAEDLKWNRVGKLMCKDFYNFQMI